MERLKCLQCIELREINSIPTEKMDKMLPEERDSFNLFFLKHKHDKRKHDRYNDVDRCDSSNGTSFCLKVPGIKEMLKFLDMETVCSIHIAGFDWRGLKELYG